MKFILKTMEYNKIYNYAYGEHYSEMPKHNALWDAETIKACYEKLTKQN